VRRTLGIRTVFNLIAPLSNPARPKYQLLGVSESRLLRPMAEALAALGVVHAMVVHGDDGLDEFSLAGATRVVEVKGGELRTYEIAPADFGLTPASAASFLTADVAEATELLRRTLAGDPGPAQDVLALNAGAAIYVGGGADTLADGVGLARRILASGRALDTIERLRRTSLGETAPT
jgi:anthranilate phosphoribosyltransferase